MTLPARVSDLVPFDLLLSVARLGSLGQAAEAQQCLRHAIYLDRSFALAHYQLGLALERDRQMPAAARSFGNVLKVLASAPDDALVTAGSGVTATGLKELARTHLKESNPT